MNNNAKFLEISQAHRISRLLLLLGGCVSKTVDEAICGRGKKTRKGQKKTAPSSSIIVHLGFSSP